MCTLLQLLQYVLYKFMTLTCYHHGSDVSPEQYDGGQPSFSIGICAVDGSVQLIEQE